VEHTVGFDDLALLEYLPRRADIALEEGLSPSAEAWRVRWTPGMYYS